MATRVGPAPAQSGPPPAAAIDPREPPSAASAGDVREPGSPLTVTARPTPGALPRPGSPPTPDARELRRRAVPAGSFSVPTEQALARPRPAPLAPAPAGGAAPRAAPSSDARRDAARVLTAPGFALLDEPRRSALERLFAATDPVLAEPARRAVLALVSSRDFAAKTPADQRDALARVLDDQPAGKWPVGAVAGGYAAARRHEVVGPTDVAGYDFDSQVADARRYEVVVGEVRVPVYVARTRQGEPNHDVREIADGLSRLPPGVLAAVREVRLHPTRNPADAYWAQVYDEAGFTSYMTAGASGIVDVWIKGASQPQDVAASFVHETGHIMSQRRFGPETDARWDPWKAAMQGDAVRASGYAKNGPGEDFCETLSLYSAVRGSPAEATYRALMPRRFAMLDALTAPPPSG